jgi:hypothetical protein
MGAATSGKTLNSLRAVIAVLFTGSASQHIIDLLMKSRIGGFLIRRSTAEKGLENRCA